MATGPLVSLILVVKNGLPYLPRAVESVAAQTYRNFEVVVQDGASTDGTLDYLQSVRGLLPLEFESAPDAGIGQAYNRALKRCRGEIIGSIDADNLLESEALATVVARFAQQPAAAALYGAVRMLDAQGAVASTWVPPAFDWLGLLQCDIVPPFGQSFFSRRVCGEALRFDEELKTCADFDLWLRLSHLPILQVNDFIGRVRVSPKSMSCRVETYDQFCLDKLSALRKHLDSLAASRITEPLFHLAASGIYSWAAESIQRLEGPTSLFAHYLALAAEHNPASQSFRRLLPLPPLPATAEDQALEQRASLLFDVGPATVEKLERSVYGPPAPNLLTVQGEGLVINPSTPRDHFSTPFRQIQIPSEADAGWAFLTVRFPEHACPERVTICLQDQTYTCLARTQTSGGTIKVRVPGNVTGLRLSFAVSSNQPCLFPDQAKLSFAGAEPASTPAVTVAPRETQPTVATQAQAPVSPSLPLRERLGRMLARRAPISEAELHQANLTLTALLDAADPAMHLKRNGRTLPAAVQPLLLAILAAAWAEGDLGLSQALENVHRVLVQPPVAAVHS